MDLLVAHDQTLIALVRLKGSRPHGALRGIRPRDPHLDKVVFFIPLVAASPPTCASVHPVSSPSIESAPVAERSTIGLILNDPIAIRVANSQSVTRTVAPLRVIRRLIPAHGSGQDDVLGPLSATDRVRLCARRRGVRRRGARTPRRARPALLQTRSRPATGQPPRPRRSGPPRPRGY